MMSPRQVDLSERSAIGKEDCNRATAILSRIRLLPLLLALNARFALHARLAQRRGRTLLSVAGVALGVALGFGVHLVNRAAVEDLAAGVRAFAGEADLEVRGGRGGFAESVYAALARLPGVAVHSPALELQAGLAEGGGLSTLRIIGIDPLRAAQLQPQLFAQQPQLMAELLKPDTVLLSAGAAETLRLGKGSSLTLLAGLAPVELEVAGAPGSPPWPTCPPCSGASGASAN